MVFYMLAKPHGYTGLGIQLQELLKMDLRDFLFHFERLAEIRQREEEQWARLKKK